jgi:hypothetical protein
MIDQEYMDLLGLVKVYKDNGFVYVDLETLNDLTISLTRLGYSYYVDDEITENKVLVIEWDRDKTFQENSENMRKVKEETL